MLLIKRIAGRSRDRGLRGQMYAMPRESADAGGLTVDEPDASPGEYEDGLQPTAEQWYENGTEDADTKMGQ